MNAPVKLSTEGLADIAGSATYLGVYQRGRTLVETWIVSVDDGNGGADDGDFLSGYRDRLRRTFQCHSDLRRQRSSVGQPIGSVKIDGITRYVHIASGDP